MKRVFEFRVNERGRLYCIVTEQRMQKRYSGEKAKALLKEADYSRYNVASISERRIKVSNKENVIYLKDLEAFVDNGYIAYIPRMQKSIAKAYAQKQAEKKEFKKGVGSKIVSGGILTMALLSATAGIKKINEKTPDLTPIIVEEITADEEIDLVVENTTVLENDEIKVTVSNELDDILANEELIQELDSNESEFMNGNVQTVYYDTNFTPDLVKYEHASNYMDVIEKYSQKWGLSPNLIMCLLSQESGGYEKNLMQITFDSWKDMPITQYDFNKGVYQTIVLTDNENLYRGKGYTCINRQDLLNKNTNISVACCILRQSIDYMNGHVIAGIQCYNYGVGAMTRVLETTAQNTGVSVDEILANQSNTSFLEYTNIIKNYGDSEYFDHIINYNLADDKVFSINHFNRETGETTETKILIADENQITYS